MKCGGYGGQQVSHQSRMIGIAGESSHIAVGEHPATRYLCYDIVDLLSELLWSYVCQDYKISIAMAAQASASASAW